MQTPSTLWIWLMEQAGFAAWIASLLGFGLLVLYVSATVRRARIRRLRTGLNEGTFVDSLVIYGFDAGIARSTYRYLQQMQQIGFPIDGCDLLDEDLGLSASAVEWAVRDLVMLNDRIYQPGLQHTPLVTVEDLARLVQASPRMAAMAA